MGGARASRLHLLGECLGSKQELPQSLWPGALLGAGLVVPHSQPAAFIKELIDNFASHLREASGSIYLGVSWACSPTRGTLHPSYACGSTCTEWVLQRWTLEAAQSWEADLVHKGRSTLRSRCSQAPAQWTCVRRPVSSIPTSASRSSRSPTAA